MSDFVKDVQFIPISGERTFCPVGPIARYYRGFFYVEDGESCEIVKISEDGTVVGRIGSQGRAADEYLTITSFDVNPLTSEVYVLDATRNTMVVYSGDGDYVRSFSLNDSGGLYRDFAIFPNGNIIGCNFMYEGPSVRRGVWMVDQEGHFLKQVVSVPENSRYYVRIPLPEISRTDIDTVCIMGPVGDDSIYKIDSEGDIETRYLFDFGSQISRRDLHREASLPIPDYFFLKDGFCASSHDFIITLSNGNEYYKVIYTLHDNGCYVCLLGTDVVIEDVANFLGGMCTDGSRYLNFCDAENLPSDIPNPDSTSLWMVVSHLK